MELYEGLDADDSLEFDDQLDYLQKKKWEGKDLPEVSSFFVWFREHKAEVIKQGMLKDARISAGLGCLPERFTTNASEALNVLIKSGVKYTVRVHYKLHAMIKEEREFEQAIIDRVKLKLNPLYKLASSPGPFPAFQSCTLKSGRAWYAKSLAACHDDRS